MGNWTVVESTTAHNGSYLAWDARTGSTAGSAWATFVPREIPVSGHYELFLRLPAEDSACSPRARNASVIVRGSGAYSHVTVDLDPNGDLTTTDAIATPDRRLAGTSSEFPSGGSYISLGKYTLLRGADSLVTVDTSYAGDSCMAVDSIKMIFVEALSSGCTDPLAENYDAVVEEDDGSCLYRGGRGVNTKSWSAMSSQYKLDDWYPAEEYEVWATGEYCAVPDGFGQENETACWHDNCKMHQQCGTTSFCCVASEHHGCTPVHNIEGQDEEGWKLIFRHDINAAGYWDHGMWEVDDESEIKTKFSMLDQLESFRRPGDGRFEFKMCWPESGFKSCQHWVQLLNPLRNPDLTNAHATCINCPYYSDTDENGDEKFYGLLYSGDDHLLHGDQDGYYFRLGEESVIGSNKIYTNAMYGPQLSNDDGSTEYPSIVELYVRPDFNGASCIDCKACFDENGGVRMANFSAYGDEMKWYMAPACPEYCLAAVSPKPRAATLLATHQLVASTNGLSERECEVVVSYDAVEEVYTNQTICEGHETIVAGSMPTEMEFGKVGGMTSRAFFVAPRTANYTFNFKANDGGELWLSPNADPRASKRLISAASMTTSTDYADGFGALAPGSDAVVSTALCGEWSCVGDRCFRAFGGRLSYDNAERACHNYGGHLGAPRSWAEKSVVGTITAAQGIGWHWLGLNDRNQEFSWLYADGTFAGYDDMTTDYGWSLNEFASTEPNDYGGDENCAAAFRGYSWIDRSCLDTLPFVCEIVDGCGGAFESDAIVMEKGETRYLESISYNDQGSEQSLLTLTIDDGESFTTSEVRGLSGEFFQAIQTNAPAIDVSINDIKAACNQDTGDGCSFTYESASTPYIDAIEPSESVSGVTLITVTGTGFSPRPYQNEVSFGGSPCVVSRSNDTFIECTVPLAEGTAGTFKPAVKVFNKGFAMNPRALEHKILMIIDSISPLSGSLYGGVTLTLTGSGFAKFGLHNEIKLQLRNDTKVLKLILLGQPLIYPVTLRC